MNRRRIRHSLLFVSLIGYTACSFVGDFVPVDSQGGKVTSRCFSNDSLLVEAGDVTSIASGTWVNLGATFYVTIRNHSGASVRLVPSRVGARSRSSEPARAQWIVRDGQSFVLRGHGLGLSKRHFRKAADEFETDEDYLASIPTSIEPGREVRFRIAIDAVYWRGLKKNQIVWLDLPLQKGNTIELRSVAFQIRRGYSSNRHLGDSCPLEVHSM